MYTFRLIFESFSVMIVQKRRKLTMYLKLRVKAKNISQKCRSHWLQGQVA